MQEDPKEENVFLPNSNKRNGHSAKKTRLDCPQDFKRCFLSRKRITNKAFVLHYADNGGLQARLGIRIAKKKVKKAVDRNKIKRIAREVFRKGQFSGIDIVLILKNEKNYDHSKCFILINDLFNDLIKK